MADSSLHDAPVGGPIFFGWIKTTFDALLVFEAARRGVIPRVTRRFHDYEKRQIIQSGVVLIFTEDESGIRRWTDPFIWSSSRMLGNFLVYYERDVEQSSANSPYTCSAMIEPERHPKQGRDYELEKHIYGSLGSKGKDMKPNGLIKKTISLRVEEVVYHLVSYYNPSDVRNGSLPRPSFIRELAALDVSPELLKTVSQLRRPPRVDVDSQGNLLYISEEDELRARVHFPQSASTPDVLVDQRRGYAFGTPSNFMDEYYQRREALFDRCCCESKPALLPARFDSYTPDALCTQQIGAGQQTSDRHPPICDPSSCTGPLCAAHLAHIPGMMTPISPLESTMTSYASPTATNLPSLSASTYAFRPHPVYNVHQHLDAYTSPHPSERSTGNWRFN